MKPLPLKFRLDELGAQMTPFEGELSATYLLPDLKGLLGDLGYGVPGPAHLKGELYRVEGGEIFLKGEFDLKLNFACVRCLNEQELHLKQKVQVTLAQGEPPQEGLEEINLDEQDQAPEVYNFSGVEVDLKVVFREEILLALPMNPNCASVEAVCVSLEEPEPEPIDPRWAPLLELKKKLI